MKKFSQREGYARSPDIKFRNELPAHLREPIVELLREAIGGRYLLERVVKLLNPYGIDELPTSTEATLVPRDGDDPDTITAKRILFACDWYQLYDLIEDVIAQLDFYEEELRNPDEELRAYRLRNNLNQYFIHAGIGWQILGDEVVTRGDSAFEQTVADAKASLQAAERATAAKHLGEALRALSHRPEANPSGAVYHALGALESVARDVTGQPNATLGEIVKRQKGIIPKPLDKAIAHIWGYASENARHVREGVEPGHEEAVLIVSASAAVITYLVSKK
jgi:hypothetical protein